MAETRMDLNEASKLLGITPNAVRHRAKTRQFPFENSEEPYKKDNKHKWWVFFDPDRLPPSNDTSNSSSKDASKRPSNGAKISGEIKALQGHVHTLNESLALERAEVARLRQVEADSVDLRVKVAGLDQALSAEREETARLRLVEAESVDLRVKVAGLDQALISERAETARLRLVERDAADLRVKVAAATGELDALKNLPPRRPWWRLW